MGDAEIPINFFVLVDWPLCSKLVCGFSISHESTHGVRSRVDRSTCAGVGSKVVGDNYFPDCDESGYCTQIVWT